MTEETLETIILGHIAKELKDEIQIGRQVNLAKTIMQALRIHDVMVELPDNHVCRYSKAMDQPYPRKCIDCGEVEGN
jgi:hypothetical protein